MKTFEIASSDKIFAVRVVGEKPYSKTGICKKSRHRSGNVYFLSPDGGAYPSGNGDALSMPDDTRTRRLKKLLRSKTAVNVRMCHSAGGNDGEIAAQKLAGRLHCKVIGYAGPVNYYGGRAFYTKRDPDRPMPYFQHFFQNPKPKIFYPQLEKNR